MLIIGILHLFLPIILLLYTIFASKKYDKIVSIFILLLPLHWILLDGECIISLIYKSIKNPEYEIGDNIGIEDIHDTIKYLIKR